MANIKEPVTRGVAKVPVVIQLEALECGAASLAMVMAYYNKWLPLEQVRLDCGVSRDGANAKNIMRAARSYGMTAKGFRYEPEALRKKGKFPCIIHWNMNHFVVCCGFRGRYAYINDPARGNLKIPMDEFDRSFTGICIFITPSDAFEPGGKRKSMLTFACRRLTGAGTSLAFLLLATILGYFFSVLNPAFSRFFMDRLLTGENRELLLPFIGILAVLGILQVLVSAVQAMSSMKINGKLAVIGSSTFMWKVFKMPMEFFSQRMAGDIQQRKETNTQIAATLMGTVIPLVLSAIMMVFYLVVMLRYSPLLTLIGMATLGMNLFLGRIISQKRLNITRIQSRDSGKLSSATVSAMQMIETIKATGAENGFFGLWADYQASLNLSEVKYTNINVYLGMIPAFLVELANYAVLVLGVFLVIQGKITIGMVFAFQSLMTLFMDPAMTMISAGQMIQEMRAQMERVDDIMEYPEDVHFRDTPLDDGTDYGKLSGIIELKDVTFGYSRLSDPLIQDFSMRLEPGSRVAFVGASGCGKSTLAKLVSGLYQPWSGEILFDGKSISEIDRSVFTGSVAVVDQDIILFEDTIANNIKMWDDSIEDFEMILAARDAQLHDDIMTREGGYRAMLTEGGGNLSGGQRQRLEIARVLAQDPSIIIMDEATSALDARTEYELVKAVKDRGITCIVIAHRLSTIRDCDEIIVLDHGVVVERGTHDELMANGGFYNELIASD